MECDHLKTFLRTKFSIGSKDDFAKIGVKSLATLILYVQFFLVLVTIKIKKGMFKVIVN